jgi:hypothetical protein
MTVKLTVKLTPEELVEIFEWHAKRLVESDEELEARASGWCGVRIYLYALWRLIAVVC